MADAAHVEGIYLPFPYIFMFSIFRKSQALGICDFKRSIPNHTVKNSFFFDTSSGTNKSGELYRGANQNNQNDNILTKSESGIACIIG